MIFEDGVECKIKKESEESIMSFYAFGRALFTIIKYNKPPLADGDDTGHYQYDDDSNSDDSSDRYDYDESSTIRFG